MNIKRKIKKEKQNEKFPESLADCPRNDDYGRQTAGRKSKAKVVNSCVGSQVDNIFIGHSTQDEECSMIIKNRNLERQMETEELQLNTSKSPLINDNIVGRKKRKKSFLAKEDKDLVTLTASENEVSQEMVATCSDISTKRKAKLRVQVSEEVSDDLISSKLSPQSSFGASCMPNHDVFIECDVQDNQCRKKSKRKNKHKKLTKVEEIDENTDKSLELIDKLLRKETEKLKFDSADHENDSAAIKPLLNDSVSASELILSEGEGGVVDQCQYENSDRHQRRKKTTSRVQANEEESVALPSSNLSLESIYGESCALSGNASIGCDVKGSRCKKKTKKKSKCRSLTELGEGDVNANDSMLIDMLLREERKKLHPAIESDSKIAKSLTDVVSTVEVNPSVSSEVKDCVDVVERRQDEGSERGSTKKKTKSKFRVDREVNGSKSSLESSCLANCKSNLEGDGDSLDCDNQRLKKERKKKKKIKVVSELQEVNGESGVSVEPSEPFVTASSNCDGIVKNFSESSHQLDRPIKRERNISEVLSPSVDHAMKECFGDLEDTSFARGNSFTHALDCNTVLARTSNEFCDGDNEILAVDSMKKRFKCEVCQRSYTRRDNLQVHMKTHSSERRFQCNQCNSSFNYKHVLQDHLRLVHLSPEAGHIVSFCCFVCDYSTKRKQDLQKHVNSVHAGQIYACKLCTSIFSDSSNLRKHINIVHIQKADYVCCICGKNFHQADNLKKHMKVHNKNIHHCPVCNREFASLQRLSIHLGTHVPKVGLNCPFCEYVLASEKDERLKRHIREVHRNQEYRT